MFFDSEMEKNRRQNVKNSKFCAKCADVEKQALKLCTMNNI